MMFYRALIAHRCDMAACIPLQREVRQACNQLEVVVRLLSTQKGGQRYVNSLLGEFVAYVSQMNVLVTLIKTFKNHNCCFLMFDLTSNIFLCVYIQQFIFHAKFMGSG